MSASAPSRRALLRSAAALPLAAGPAIGSSHPDADLIGACAEFDACELAVRAIYDDPATEDDEAADESGALIEHRGDVLSRRIVSAQARTADGILAIARSLALHAGDGGFSMEISSETTAGRLSMTLLREALRLSGRPLPEALTAEVRA